MLCLGIIIGIFLTSAVIDICELITENVKEDPNEQ